jgi:hypothetical protein
MTLDSEWVWSGCGGVVAMRCAISTLGGAKGRSGCGVGVGVVAMRCAVSTLDSEWVWGWLRCDVPSQHWAVRKGGGQ